MIERKFENKLLALAKEPGFESLQDLATTLERIGEKKLASGGSLVLPNLFLSTNEGYDFETILLSLEELLDHYGLMKFSGPVRHYELSLDYSMPNAPDFPAFTALYDAVEKYLARFNHAYSGILVIDITDWVVRSATSEKKFLDFLHYMSEVDERTLAIYVDMSGSPSKADLAYRLLITKTRLEKLRLVLEDPKVALNVLEKELSSFGFSLDKEAKQAIIPTLKAILNTKGHEGPWTMHQLAEDIVYNAYKNEGELKTTVTKEALKPFHEGGKWLLDFVDKKRYYMGLVGE